MAASPRWRTTEVNGRKITYAVVQRDGTRVVLIKRG